MSSLGGLVVFTVFTLTTLILIGYTLNNISTQMSLFTYYKEYIEKRTLDSKREIVIRSLEVSQDNTTVSLKLLNRCGEPIHVKDFPLIDLILVYVSVDNETRAVWLSYSLDRALNEGWRPLTIKQNNDTELINPVSGEFKSGLWDPGEVLYVEAWVSSEKPITGEPVFIISCIKSG